ncbi:MAG: DUF488 domain-containing protein [Dehalococcoidia bacterium]|nr:DUF488 domain-containing protein [Dehalococcoidia bacterium]
MGDTHGSIFTIGHSDHPPGTLLQLLVRTGIEVLVDVRSNPSSRWVPHANPHDLRRILKPAGIQYIYMGDALGGRPESLENDVQESAKVKYEAIRKTQAFQRGLERLLGSLMKHRTCVMCAEEDPSECHRNLLVGEGLRLMGIRALHIRGSGAVQTDEELRKEKLGVPSNQLELPFGDMT